MRSPGSLWSPYGKGAIHEFIREVKVPKNKHFDTPENQNSKLAKQSTPKIRVNLNPSKNGYNRIRKNSKDVKGFDRHLNRMHQSFHERKQS